MRLFDISTPVREGLPGFPGDPETRIERVHDMRRGDAYNLSRLTLSSHVGTHVDPPLHFVPRGAAADRLDLSALNGLCRVVRVPNDRASVGLEDLARAPLDAERVLFRTANSERPPGYQPDYVALDPAVADELVRRHIRLVGVDGPSAERDPQNRFPVHRTLLGSGTLILEGLRLGEIDEGDYELRCFPLLLEGCDGAPSRALLIAP